MILLIGVILSNLFLLGAMIVLYKLISSFSSDEDIAKRAVFYLLICPTSFYFSAFYTKSIYLFFSVAAFYAASKRSWMLCGILGFLAALSRPVGVLIFIPLVLLYLSSIDYKLFKIKAESAWLLLVPSGLLVYLMSLYNITHDLFAPFKAQFAWGKILSFPWQTIANPVGYDPYIGMFQKITAIGCLILVLVAWVILPKRAYALYAFLLIAPSFLSGSLMSFARLAMVAFPFFWVFSIIGKHRSIDTFISTIFLLLLGLFMAGWSQFYPIF